LVDGLAKKLDITVSQVGYVFIRRAFHEVAETQKTRALELVRGMKGEPHWLDKLPMSEGYDKALSEVEEAIKQEL